MNQNSVPTNQTELNKAVSLFRKEKTYKFHLNVGFRAGRIARYLDDYKITDVVVGVSGGIDSAVVLGLLVEARKFYPELTIHGYTIHFDVYDDVFETKYVDDLENHFGTNVNFKRVNATQALETLFNTMGLDLTNRELLAQSSYALRYQMFFTYAQALGAVTIGTTNRDEFEYAGWFGKNSDMMVDLQVITDWNKCQVIEAAKFLKIPKSIINRAPVGDLINDTTDEYNFGCTYDELAYFQEKIHPLNTFENDFLDKKFAKLRALHEKNKHKYMGQTFNPYFIK